MTTEANDTPQAAPAVGAQVHLPVRHDPERAAFEAWFSDDGKWTAAIQRSGDGYMLAAAQTAWGVWQASAKATRERCIVVCNGERLIEPTDSADDIAYGHAIDDCIAAIRRA
jgi:hypothetical protein